ncbi:hypothetical protein HPP92_017281 [Vanilla planifolia]|uniref:Uncharacterized protein n=1 Tax=Vanilla planifolia TaxID=51239 RepID=A0A835QAU8_VANPL|nr:hypothetical protein HPP92_017281 [Vanilla planifolia]
MAIGVPMLAAEQLAAAAAEARQADPSLASRAPIHHAHRRRSRLGQVGNRCLGINLRMVAPAGQGGGLRSPDVVRSRVTRRMTHPGLGGQEAGLAQVICARVAVEAAVVDAEGKRLLHPDLRLLLPLRHEFLLSCFAFEIGSVDL